MYKDFQKLMAETYDNGNATPSSEIDFWDALAKNANGPILELGSGTGRVLIPLLEKGHDVLGLENSSEMIEVCNTNCVSKNIPVPTIYELSMLNFAIDKKFNLIILPSGSLSLFTKNKEVESLFASVYNHLNSDGSFVFEAINIPTKENEWEDEQAWTGSWHENSKEGTIITERKLMKYNKKTHCWKTPVIYEKYKDGKRINSEINVRVGRLFSQDEVAFLLSKAGFRDIVAYNALTHDPVSASSSAFTCMCKK